MTTPKIDDKTREAIRRIELEHDIILAEEPRTGTRVSACSCGGWSAYDGVPYLKHIIERGVLPTPVQTERRVQAAVAAVLEMAALGLEGRCEYKFLTPCTQLETSSPCKWCKEAMHIRSLAPTDALREATLRAQLEEAQWWFDELKEYCRLKQIGWKDMEIARERIAKLQVGR